MLPPLLWDLPCPCKIIAHVCISPLTGITPLFLTVLPIVALPHPCLWNAQVDSICGWPCSCPLAHDLSTVQCHTLHPSYLPQARLSLSHVWSFPSHFISRLKKTQTATKKSGNFCTQGMFAWWSFHLVVLHLSVSYSVLTLVPLFILFSYCLLSTWHTISKVFGSGSFLDVPK